MVSQIPPDMKILNAIRKELIEVREKSQGWIKPTGIRLHPKTCRALMLELDGMLCFPAPLGEKATVFGIPVTEDENLEYPAYLEIPNGQKRFTLHAIPLDPEGLGLNP